MHLSHAHCKVCIHLHPLRPSLVLCVDCHVSSALPLSHLSCAQPCTLSIGCIRLSCPAKKSFILDLASVYSLAVTSMASSGNPRWCIIQSSLLWPMVLNVDLISTYSKYRSCFTFASDNIMSFCFLKPSCTIKMWRCSAYMYKHSAITHVHISYRVFASAIGPQFAKSCLLPFLCRSTAETPSTP